MNILEELGNSLIGLFESSGFATNDWRNYIMIVISCILMYLAIKKQFEPLLLLPIAFGMLLVNLFPAIMGHPELTYTLVDQWNAANPG